MVNASALTSIARNSGTVELSAVIVVSRRGELSWRQRARGLLLTVNVYMTLSSPTPVQGRNLEASRCRGRLRSVTPEPTVVDSTAPVDVMSGWRHCHARRARLVCTRSDEAFIQRRCMTRSCGEDDKLIQCPLDMADRSRPLRLRVGTNPDNNLASRIER